MEAVKAIDAEMRSVLASHFARLAHGSGALPSQSCLQTTHELLSSCNALRPALEAFEATRPAFATQQARTACKSPGGSFARQPLLLHGTGKPQDLQGGVRSYAGGTRPTQPRVDGRRPAARPTQGSEPAVGKVGTIYVNTTSNNTICTLVDMRGNPLGWSSAGSEGYKNARKQTTTAAQAVAEKIAAKSQEKGYYVVRVVMKGMGYGKQTAVSTLIKSGLQISELHEVTPTPHNGCRAPKKRRP